MRPSTASLAVGYHLCLSCCGHGRAPRSTQGLPRTPDCRELVQAILWHPNPQHDLHKHLCIAGRLLVESLFRRRTSPTCPATRSPAARSAVRPAASRPAPRPPAARSSATQGAASRPVPAQPAVHARASPRWRPRVVNQRQPAHKPTAAPPVKSPTSRNAAPEQPPKATSGSGKPASTSVPAAPRSSDRQQAAAAAASLTSSRPRSYHPAQ